MAIQALHPQSITFLQEEALISFAKIFDSNVDDLANEPYQIKSFGQEKKRGMQRLTSPLEFVVFLEPFNEVFHELFRLWKIAIVIPVSSASCEHSFSALSLIKIHLRTTVTDERLSHLGVLSPDEQKRWTRMNLWDGLVPVTKTKNNAVLEEQNVQ